MNDRKDRWRVGSLSKASSQTTSIDAARPGYRWLTAWLNVIVLSLAGSQRGSSVQCSSQGLYAALASHHSLLGMNKPETTQLGLRMEAFTGQEHRLTVAHGMRRLYQGGAL